MNKKNDVEDSTYIINVINTDLSCSLLNQKDKNHDDCSFNKLLENKMFVRVSKAFIMVFMIAGVEIGKLYITPAETVSCLIDPLHNIFEKFNNKINEDREFARGFQISSSLLMDLTFFILFIYWVLYIRSLRFIIATLLFYGFRALNQILIQMTFPPGFFWEAPGFPSLTVPYGNTSDFFFSGHVGFLSLCTYEWYMVQKYKMMFLTICINIYMIIVLLAFRTHYGIDITTGLVVAHWIFFLVVKFENEMNKGMLCIGRTIYNFLIKDPITKGKRKNENCS